jgi:hypothetical protein
MKELHVPQYGGVIRIDHMSNDHLHNTIKLLRRKRVSVHDLAPYVLEDVARMHCKVRWGLVLLNKGIDKLKGGGE